MSCTIALYTVGYCSVRLFLTILPHVMFAHVRAIVSLCVSPRELRPQLA